MAVHNRAIGGNRSGDNTTGDKTTGDSTTGGLDVFHRLGDPIGSAKDALVGECAPMSLERPAGEQRTGLTDTVCCMSSSRESRILRFGAGSHERPRSLVWRLLVNKYDAYVGAHSALMGLFKISLHEREWIAAFTSQSGVRIKEKGGSRRAETWLRPSEYQPGYTRGPVIAVPYVPPELGRNAAPSDAAGKTVHWMRPPDVGQALVFVHVLVRPDFDRSALGLRLGRPTWIGGVEKADGEAIVVVATYIPMEPAYQLGCEQLLRDNRFTARGEPGPGDGGSLLWVSTQAGLPSIADLPAPVDWETATEPSSG